VGAFFRDGFIKAKEFQDKIAISNFPQKLNQLLKNQEMKRKVFSTIILFVFIALNSTAQVKGTFTDPRDSTTYKTVVIGSQTWMAENMNYVGKGYSWCYKDEATNCKKFGKLYRFESAQRACPKGWHLPSYIECDTLIEYLGGKKVAGGKMKSPDYWEQGNEGATNSSGFSAIPGGHAVYTATGIGGYGGIGAVAEWWTSTRYAGFFCTLKDTKAKMETGLRANYQLSVRCLKDK
jgi:uncharacterized protein (TIGR02145 family)